MSSREEADPRAESRDELGARIKAVRESQPPNPRKRSDVLSQVDFGALFDPPVNREQVSNWERGQEPQTRYRIRLSELSGRVPGHFALRREGGSNGELHAKLDDIINRLERVEADVGKNKQTLADILEVNVDGFGTLKAYIEREGHGRGRAAG